MPVILLLLASFFYPSKSDPWALYYNNDHSGSKYIIVDGKKVTSLGFDDVTRKIIVSTVFSGTDSIVTFSVISHTNRVYYKQSFSYNEYSDMQCCSEIKMDGLNNTIERIDKNGNLEYTAHLSESIPNVHPLTILCPDIKNAPEVIQYPLFTDKLIEVIRDPEEIARLQKQTLTIGYTQMGLMEVQMLTLQNTGMTIDELGEELERQKAKMIREKNAGK